LPEKKRAGDATPGGNVEQPRRRRYLELCRLREHPLPEEHVQDAIDEIRPEQVSQIRKLRRGFSHA